MDKDLRIDRRLKDCSLALEIASNQRRIRKVTVVCKSECAARIVDTERLRMGALDWVVLALAVVACALACGGAYT